MEPSWRGGNRTQLFPEAEYYVPALLDALDSAEESVMLEQYLICSGAFAIRVISALCNAAHRGVDVSFCSMRMVQKASILKTGNDLIKQG